MSTDLTGKIVLIAGATSASGEAVARALVGAGATVLAVGTRPEALAALADAVPGVDTRVCDLGDRSAVAELAMRIHVKFGNVDGLVHLVGGWRGGGGIAGQSDEDWAFLERGFETLRNSSRVFYEDLVAVPAGRLAVVSSTAVDRPTAGGANYAAAKAAADAWTRAVAQGFTKDAPNAAAAIFVVKSLAGLEAELASRVVDLWSEDPSTINGVRTLLTDRADGENKSADPARM
ncbi:SDR family NAD(P)-dependent oxidoreductase [Leifsonia sp. NPDC058230]|uniref:SDR family NAD(P)-dependent oxidoreductase n=1 Tax=Leifsonia sp. NPDC058230 TaxID=3346391 RepID=UPI0036DD7C1E